MGSCQPSYFPQIFWQVVSSSQASVSGYIKYVGVGTMILIYKKIKKHNERKRIEAQPTVTDSVGENPVTQSPAHDTSSDKKTVSPEEAAEKKRRRVYRWKIILGLFAPFCLQSLDTTIIASALPYIAEDFGE